MSNATTTATTRERRNPPAVTNAETTKRGEAYAQADERSPQNRSPKEFYVELTKQSDARAILMQLAEN